MSRINDVRKAGPLFALYDKARANVYSVSDVGQPSRLALGMARSQKANRMQKIFLRAWEDQVVDELFLVLRGEEVYRFIPSCPPDSASQLAAKLRPEGLNPPLVFSVHLDEPGDPVVGLVSAHPVSLGHWDLGFMVGQAHWRKGIGKEAVRLLLLEVRRQIGPQRVVARVDSENTASLRALKANGFVEMDRIETILKFKASVDVELECNV